MITNSKGNICLALVSCAPTSYCEDVPVPLSPMIAKRTESFSTGGTT